MGKNKKSQQINSNERFSRRNTFKTNNNRNSHYGNTQHAGGYGWKYKNSYNNENKNNGRWRNDGDWRESLNHSHGGSRGHNRQSEHSIGNPAEQMTFPEEVPVDPTTVNTEQIAEEQLFFKFRDHQQHHQPNLVIKTPRTRQDYMRFFDTEQSGQELHEFAETFGPDNGLNKIETRSLIPKECGNCEPPSSIITIENIKKEKSKIEDKNVIFKKEISNKICSKSSSSNDSSCSSSSDDDVKKVTKKRTSEIDKPSVDTDIIMLKSIKEKKIKPISEEEVVCIGKLKRNYTISDESGEDNQAGHEDHVISCKKLNKFKEDNSKTVDHCIICDKRDHTSFQCQMICKNCSAPYHNLKSCPNPANANVVLQSFMEFCMYQINSFNPEQRFPVSTNILANTFPTLSKVSTMASNKLKRPHSKKRKSHKKNTKVNLSESDDNANNTEEDTGTDESSDSSNFNKTNFLSKTKKKRNKSMPVTNENSFLKQQQTPFSFPIQPHVTPFVSPNPHFNPLLYGQMLHGAFPTSINFNN